MFPPFPVPLPREKTVPVCSYLSGKYSSSPRVGPGRAWQGLGNRMQMKPSCLSWELVLRGGGEQYLMEDRNPGEHTAQASI